MFINTMGISIISILLGGLVARCMAADPPSDLCNKTSADANGTFFYSYNPHVNQGPQAGQPDNLSGQTLDVAVGLTLSQNFETDKVEYSLWYNTNGANYRNDTQLGYDVCAISWSPTPFDTQVRGQADNGTCYSMFDEACITAVETAAAQYALQFYQALSGNSSSSSSISSPLSLICGDIATSLNANLPQECSSYVNSSSSFAPAVALTGSGSPLYAFNPSCTMNGMMNGSESAYNLLQTKSANWSIQAYSSYGDYVWPQMAVWMPVSAGGSEYSINNTKAGMICGRINNYTEDSYVPTPLKATSTNTTTSSTPSSSSSSGSFSLSGGAIAGIVVGCVVGVALILGLLFFLLKRRRQSKNSQIQEIHEKDSNDTLYEAPSNEAPKNDETSTVKTVGSLSEAPDTAISELPPDGNVTWTRRQELSAGKEHEVFELPGEFADRRISEESRTLSPGVSSEESGDWAEDVRRRLSGVTE